MRICVQGPWVPLVARVARVLQVCGCFLPMQAHLGKLRTGAHIPASVKKVGASHDP